MDLPLLLQNNISYCDYFQFSVIQSDYSKSEVEFEKTCTSYSGMPSAVKSEHIHITVEHVPSAHWRGWFEKFDHEQKIYVIVCNDGLGYANPPFHVFER